MDRRTDRHTVLESSYGNMSAHKKFQLKAQNEWLAVDPYMPPRRSGMHNNIYSSELPEEVEHIISNSDLYYGLEIT